MQQGSAVRLMKRRKELILFVCALALGILAIWASLSGWLEKENWGRPVATRQVGSKKALPEVVFPDFSTIWRKGGRNPFGDAAVALESGGKARIPLPPLPPLVPEMPPAPIIEPVDLFYAHIGGMDVFARGLKNAAKMLEDKTFERAVQERYRGWNSPLGSKIENKQVGFEELEAYILEHGEPKLQSGRQELLENLLNSYV